MSEIAVRLRWLLILQSLKIGVRRLRWIPVGSSDRHGIGCSDWGRHEKPSLISSESLRIRADRKDGEVLCTNARDLSVSDRKFWRPRSDAAKNWRFRVSSGRIGANGQKKSKLPAVAAVLAVEKREMFFAFRHFHSLSQFSRSAPPEHLGIGKTIYPLQSRNSQKT